MLKHIVAWRLKENAHGNSKRENAALIRQKLEALDGKIPGLLKIEVGINFTEDQDASDVVLYSEFGAKEDLLRYQKHPEHLAVVPFIKEACCERRVADYEI